MIDYKNNKFIFNNLLKIKQILYRYYLVYSCYYGRKEIRVNISQFISDLIKYSGYNLPSNIPIFLGNSVEDEGNLCTYFYYYEGEKDLQPYMTEYFLDNSKVDWLNQNITKYNYECEDKNLKSYKGYLYYSYDLNFEDLFNHRKEGELSNLSSEGLMIFPKDEWTKILVNTIIESLNGLIYKDDRISKTFPLFYKEVISNPFLYLSFYDDDFEADEVEVITSFSIKKHNSDYCYKTRVLDFNGNLNIGDTIYGIYYTEYVYKGCTADSREEIIRDLKLFKNIDNLNLYLKSSQNSEDLHKFSSIII